jgi:hypothetical protein
MSASMPELTLASIKNACLRMLSLLHIHIEVVQADGVEEAAADVVASEEAAAVPEAMEVDSACTAEDSEEATEEDVDSACTEEAAAAAVWDVIDVEVGVASAEELDVVGVVEAATTAEEPAVACATEVPVAAEELAVVSALEDMVVVMVATGARAAGDTDYSIL